LNVRIDGGKTSLDVNLGTRVKSFDKGALILNQKPSDGLRVFQAVSQHDEATFWIEKFLKLQEVANDSKHTKDYLSLCKQYAGKIDESVDSSGKVKISRAFLCLFLQQ